MSDKKPEDDTGKVSAKPQEKLRKSEYAALTAAVLSLFTAFGGVKSNLSVSDKLEAVVGFMIEVKAQLRSNDADKVRYELELRDLKTINYKLEERTRANEQKIATLEARTK